MSTQVSGQATEAAGESMTWGVRVIAALLIGAQNVVKGLIRQRRACHRAWCRSAAMLPDNASLARLIRDHGGKWVIEHTGASTPGRARHGSLEYKRKDDQDRRKVLDELTELGEEIGED